MLFPVQADMRLCTARVACLALLLFWRFHFRSTRPLSGLSPRQTRNGGGGGGGGDGGGGSSGGGGNNNGPKLMFGEQDLAGPPVTELPEYFFNNTLLLWSARTMCCACGAASGRTANASDDGHRDLQRVWTRDDRNTEAPNTALCAQECASIALVARLRRIARARTAGKCGRSAAATSGSPHHTSRVLTRR